MPINLLTEEGFGMIVGSAGESFTGLLDTYGGASAAYSFRRLSSTYTGNLIEVRRSSDNTIQDIGYDANGDLDTAALLSFVGAGDGFVRTWYDQSGNANNAVQTTTSNQGQIVSGGSLIQDNGKPAIESNNTDNYSFSSITAESVFSVSSTSSYLITNYILFNTSVIQGFSIGGSFFSNNLVVVGGGGGANGPASLGQLLLIWDYDTNYRIGKNGGALSNLATAINPISVNNICRPASNQNINGFIQEIILFSSSQLSTRTGIESNINSYYSIY